MEDSIGKLFQILEHEIQWEYEVGPMRKVVHYDQIYSCPKFGDIWTPRSALVIFYKLESVWILEKPLE
jgi:hypothetical protein